MLKSSVPGATTAPGLADEFDDLFRNAVELVVQYDKASASLLQRRLSVGYAQASRLMDQLQEAGIIGPQVGSKPREVLIRTAEEVLNAPRNVERRYGYVLDVEDDYYKVPENYKIPSGNVISLDPRPQWSPHLNDAINSDAFKDNGANFPVLLGLDEKDNLQVSDLPAIGNLIVSGNPLSNKENFIDTLLLTLLLKSHPKDLKLILIDLNHYLDLYNGIPHLLSPVITEHSKSVSALRWSFMELERRVRQFAEEGVRDINSFNEKAEDNSLPHILLIAMNLLWDVETEDVLVRLIDLGVKAGIQTVIVTNRIADVPRQLKSNVAGRIVFKVISAGDSKAAGVKGAENLQAGEAIYKAHFSEQTKLKTVYTPEANVNEVIEVINPKRKALFVEDDVVLLKMYKTHLSKQGFMVDEAFTGEAALEKIKENYYDLIVTGLMMPKMNGIDLLRNIKENNFKHGKIVVLTSIAREEERNEAKALGADEYLIKAETDPSTLIGTVQRLMEN